MAGFSDQSTPRREVDRRAANPGAPLWPRREDLAGNRRVGKLRISGAEGLQETASHSGKVGRPRLVLPAGVSWSPES
jgi:hypothetical protein